MADTYDPSKIQITFGPTIITGLNDGTPVVVERTSDTWVKTTGIDGRTIRVKQVDFSGSIFSRNHSSKPKSVIFIHFFLYAGI